MMFNKDVGPDYVSTACNRLKRQHPLLGEVLDFYEQVFILQEALAGTLDSPLAAIPMETVALRLGQDLPVVEKQAFPCDFQGAGDLFRSLCEMGARFRVQSNGAMAEILSLVDGGEISLKALGQRYLAGDDAWLDRFAQNHGIDRANLEFLLYNVLKPGIVKSARAVGSLLDDGEATARGVCPVCGSRPGVSLLGENGARSLVCGFCWHEWKVERIFCALCGNRDAKKLGYVRVEGLDGIWGDVCDSCKGSLKTIDLREYDQAPYLPLELLAAISLDMMLARDGYA